MTLLDTLSRADLSVVGRELMLAAHLQDRCAIPAILKRHPMETALELAIDEWMMVSPIYTRRLQRLLGFAGDDVPTIFKGLQLDVGFAHQFMDVGYRIDDDARGEFWLRSCGALADVLPMGTDMVRGMCHDIEDPTFDATAVATNPRSRIRPVHRPPGVPRGGPDCHWTVEIDEGADPTPPHPWLAEMELSELARLPNEVSPATDEPGGWADYRRPFAPDFELELLSQPALRAVLREFAIQGHLLARAMMVAVSKRHSHDEAMAVGAAIFTGIGWIAAERLVQALDVDTDDPGAIATVLPSTHFLLPDDYVGLRLSATADGTTTITLDPGAIGLAETDPYSLPGLLREGVDGIVESLVHGVDPHAVVTPVTDGGDRSWTVVPGDPDATGARVDEPSDVAIARFSTGVDVTLRRRVPLPR